MAQPWITIDKTDTPDGVLELRKRGDRDFLILIDNRVLMNSSASRSELELGRRASEAVAGQPLSRVLIGGLGMGLTLRAALDALPDTAAVVVAELNPAIEKWCRGPLAELTEGAVQDPRVKVLIKDVAAVISDAAARPEDRFDAVIIDLYEGPGSGTNAVHDPFYGSKALARVLGALTPGGVFAVWGEAPDSGFEKRLTAAGFSFERDRPGKGGFRHVIYLARKKS